MSECYDLKRHKSFCDKKFSIVWAIFLIEWPLKSPIKMSGADIGFISFLTAWLINRLLCNVQRAVFKCVSAQSIDIWQGWQYADLPWRYVGQFLKT